MSGNRVSRAKVFGRIAGLSLLALGPTEAHILTPLPAPLSALRATNPDAEVAVIASGLEKARNLRLLSDGSLLLDAPGESLEYRVTPRADGGADVLLAAAEMREGSSRLIGRCRRRVSKWRRRSRAPGNRIGVGARRHLVRGRFSSRDSFFESGSR
jgi:hypothetical protein